LSEERAYPEREQICTSQTSFRYIRGLFDNKYNSHLDKYIYLDIYLVKFIKYPPYLYQSLKK